VDLAVRVILGHDIQFDCLGQERPGHTPAFPWLDVPEEISAIRQGHMPANHQYGLSLIMGMTTQLEHSQFFRK
jgi:hypothetical protein